jgi:hypothetical protein
VSTIDGLTLMQAHTIADALTSFALQPDSTDARIREVIDALRAIGYGDTADTMERLNAGHSVRV